MSLPSDVTVDNFKDFYQAILPYLNVGNGGTSDTPLGQVAFFDDTVAPAGWLVADGTVYNISDYPDLANQYERVHGSKNFYGGNGTTTFAVPDWDAIPAEVFGNSNIICVKAVPSSDIYTDSYAERRVGTYVDGKPKYQRCVDITLPNVTSRTWENSLVDLTDWSIDTMVSINGNGYNTVGQYLCLPYNDFAMFIDFNYDPVNKKLRSCYNSANNGNFTGTVAICYTKTTD